MTLKRGEPVELRLETAQGVELPDDLRPEVYFKDIQWRVSMMRQPMNRKHYGKDAPELDFNMLVKPAGKGKFELRLAKDTPPFYVAIHHDGFLRFFEAGPFTMADVKEGVLTVAVPKAARLDLSFDVRNAKEGELPNGRQFEIMLKQSGGSGAYLQVAHEVRPPGKDASLSITDLVPGEYRYAVSADPDRGSHPIRRDEVKPSGFHEIGFVTLGAGETKTIDAKYAPLDMDVVHGERKAVVHILKPNKEPAAGKKVVIYYDDEHYGTLPVFSGEVPADGAMTLDKLAQGEKNSLKSLGVSGYGVLVDGNSLGHFDFADDEQQKDVSFRLPLGVGDEAPDVEMIDINTKQHSRLSELRGKYVWLEFWATWCGPCQPAMAELVRTYGEQREEWGDKIAVVPISVDDTPDVVVQHAKDRGWDVFPQFWSERVEDKSNFGSSAAAKFGVNGVPTAFLIGPDGKIRWTGHPMGAKELGGSLAEFIKSHRDQ
jgi:thiol-disulfide isomerase/thioredoxin